MEQMLEQGTCGRCDKPWGTNLGCIHCTNMDRTPVSCDIVDGFEVFYSTRARDNWVLKVQENSAPVGQIEEAVVYYHDDGPSIHLNFTGGHGCLWTGIDPTSVEQTLALLSEDTRIAAGRLLSVVLPWAIAQEEMNADV